ncbi:ABC transporter ATP-binding protein [Aerococcaceae bacterium 50-4]
MEKRNIPIKEIISNLWHYISPYKGQFFLAMFATILMNIASALEPFVLGLAITELTSNVVDIMNNVPGAQINYEYIGFVALLYFLRGCVFWSGEYLGQFWLTNVVQRAIYDLRNDVAKKANTMPVSYFDSHPTGDILSRMTNDIDAITNALQQSFIQFLTAILGISLAVVSMLLIQWKLALIILVTIPLSLLIARFIINKSQSAFQNQANALGNLFGFTQEQLSGFTEIKVYGRQEDSVKEFKRRNQELRNYGFRASFLSSLMMPILNTISNMGYVVTALFGGIFAITGRLTVGNLQALVQYVMQINQPIQMLTQLSGVLQSALAAAQRVFNFLEEDDEIQEEVTGHLPAKVKGAVEFDHVRFGYDPENPLMKDISFKVEPGQTVAIVGPTGAGKTTLINLLMRFYDVDSGAILIDGVPTKSMTRDELRRHFGMVLQDAWLYTDTVLENIRFGKLKANDYEVQEAAEVANVDHFINTLPGGYEMEINEEANNISLGQKQLMTIARAVIADPDILILDEATSSVDTRLEKLIQEAMNKIMEGRTSFVIAHRLSTIRDADLILVMQQGNIIEHGNHDELMAKEGFYADLYNSQFAEESPVEVSMGY